MNIYANFAALWTRHVRKGKRELRATSWAGSGYVLATVSFSSSSTPDPLRHV